MFHQLGHPPHTYSVLWGSVEGEASGPVGEPRVPKGVLVGIYFTSIDVRTGWLKPFSLLAAAGRWSLHLAVVTQVTQDQGA